MTGLIRDLRRMPRGDDVPGKCAKCGLPVYEALCILDDAYNVWLGRCPECKALNYLGMQGLRGYDSRGMTLVLPTDEERDANGLPPDTPTSGPCGKPANQHGSILGELAHKLVGDHDEAKPSSAD